MVKRNKTRHRKKTRAKNKSLKGGLALTTTTAGLIFAPILKSIGSELTGYFLKKLSEAFIQILNKNVLNLGEEIMDRSENIKNIMRSKQKLLYYIFVEKLKATEFRELLNPGLSFRKRTVLIGRCLSGPIKDIVSDTINDPKIKSAEFNKSFLDDTNRIYKRNIPTKKSFTNRLSNRFKSFIPKGARNYLSKRNDARLKKEYIKKIKQKKRMRKDKKLHKRFKELSAEFDRSHTQQLQMDEPNIDKITPDETLDDELAF